MALYGASQHVDAGSTPRRPVSELRRPALGNRMAAPGHGRREATGPGRRRGFVLLTGQSAVEVTVTGRHRVFAVFAG